MKKVLIFGSGSIGNHLANACRKIDLSVKITDISFNALLRMKNTIYPSRYSKWDKEINLVNYKDVFKLKDKFDIVLVGTPPSSHYSLVKKIYKYINFEKIMIEKPLSTYKTNVNFKKLKLFSKKKKIFVGYNHSVSDAFYYYEKLIKKIKKKEILLIDVNWKEGWKGILNAHFWNKNEFSTYLGNLNEGGGSIHEHSHGIHLIVCLSKILKFKLASKIFKFRNNKVKNKKIYYDNYSNLSWKIDQFLINYTTDLISDPADKSVAIFTKSKKFELIFNFKKNFDLVKETNLKTSSIKFKYFKKKRATDFVREIKHIIQINNLKKYNNSYINLENGLQTQKIINSIF